MNCGILIEKNTIQNENEWQLRETHWVILTDTLKERRQEVTCTQ